VRGLPHECGLCLACSESSRSAKNYIWAVEAHSTVGDLEQCFKSFSAATFYMGCLAFWHRHSVCSNLVLSGKVRESSNSIVVQSCHYACPES
jgi:hypothetical protein